MGRWIGYLRADCQDYIELGNFTRINFSPAAALR